MTVELSGRNIYYRDEGTGPLLVLLHGWGSNTDLFDGIYRFASAKYRVIGPDLPGAGKSEEPGEPMDLDDYVSFVVSFVRAVAPEEKEITFLGHSHGGRVLIHMSAMMAVRDAGGQVPDALAPALAGADFRITRMILVDSAGIVPEKTAAQKRKSARYRFYKAFITNTGIVKLFPGVLDALQRRFGSADYAAASPVMRKTMVQVVNADLTQEMPSVTMPVLLIWGDKDTATPLSDGQRMEKLMPGAGLAVIPGVGHFSFLENPYHFDRILGSFLGIS